MNTFKSLTPLLAGLLLAAGALTAQGPAAPPPGPGPESGHGMGGFGGGMGPLSPEALADRLHDPELVKELSLSQTQLDKIDKLAYDAEKAKIDLDGEARLVQLDMKTVFSDDNFDAGKAQALVDRWAKLQEKIARRRMGNLIELRRIFTADQWRKLRETVRRKVGERMREMHEEGGGRPGRRMMRGGRGAPPPDGAMDGNPPPQ